MSNPIIKNLRRQIEDTRPKPGSMVAGFPKATVVIAELEMLIARHDALQLRVTSLEGALREACRALENVAAYQFCARDGAGRTETEKGMHKAFEQAEKASEKGFKALSPSGPQEA